MYTWFKTPCVHDEALLQFTLYSCCMQAAIFNSTDQISNATSRGLDAPHATKTRSRSTTTTTTNDQTSQASSPTPCQKTKRLMKKSVCVQSTLKPKSVPRPTAPAYANDQPQYHKRGAMQVVPRPLAPFVIEARVGRLSFYLPEQVPSLCTECCL